MKRGRLLALVTTASVTMGAFGLQTWGGSQDLAPGNLPIRLKHGTLYVSSRQTAAAAQGTDVASGNALYIVQFTGPVMASYKAALTRLGVELGDYLPENAFLVRMDGSLIRTVNDLGFVKGVQAYTSAVKLDRSLEGAPATTKVRITTFSDSAKGPVGAMTALGISPDSIGLGVITATADENRLRSLASDNNIVYIEPVRNFELLNDKAAPIMGVTPVWASGLDGSGQVVAITDTGLDTGKNDASLHQDFKGQVKSIFALGKPGDAADTLAHGTHVAGSVLGTGAGSKGLHKGTAPGAKLVFQAIADSNGGLGGIPSDIGQLFQQAYGVGARIHTNSWGVPAASGGAVYDAQSAAVDRFIWENPDYAILFAAGNDGDHDQNGQTNYSTVSTPGTSKNAITVGASQNSRPERKQGTDTSAIATFSSRGPTTDNRVKPDVVAPGTWIASTRSSQSTDSNFWAPHESNKLYGYMGGTSMATPLTAGATALIRQYYVEQQGVTPRASLLKATLINGATAMNSAYSWKDAGWGLVNLNQSLFARPFKFVNEDKGLQTNEAQTYTYQVKKGEPLKITLVWSDYPANPTASKTLVNDLDLSVKGPDSSITTGNHMLGIKGADRTNNVENVVIQAPQDGTYSVSVNAFNVPQGAQRFALVVSGNVAGGAGQSTPLPTDPSPNPPVVDKEAPTVAITSPMGGTKVSGSVRIVADARDNVGVSRVEFLANGKALGTAAVAPFEFTWDSDKSGPGQYQIEARAYDAAGNEGRAKPVTIAVISSDVGQTQDLTFTAPNGHFGQMRRYYVDVKGPGRIGVDLSLLGTAKAQIMLLDPAGRLISSADTAIKANVTAGGTYTIMVTSLGGWGDYSLKVTFPPAEGTARTVLTGGVAANGERYQVYEATTGKAGGLNAILRSTDGRADLDLYLMDSRGWIISMATSPNLNPETASALVPAGTYYLYVVADSGRSDYALEVLHAK